ncbi:Synaptic vesicle glycoprotein 2C [Eumeta japonica]|uniref:Synaptic vesicle glycoprotein 2C n=1 Tax=Eumeta variegata TaxID=151549 RepID=A0A4C1ZTJ5_EUMVA|nr:Synaptic vesicle glycoprotein 2C [Eumeta japonica]
MARWISTIKVSLDSSQKSVSLDRDQPEVVELPQAVFLEFDNSSISGNRPSISVRIKPYTTEFDALRGKGKIKLHMLPLILSWVMTVHKLGVTTLNRAVVDLSRNLFAKGQAYMALNGVKSFSVLATSSIDPRKKMSEEQACLVRAHSDSENSAKLGSFGSISCNMTYTEGKLAGGESAGETGGEQSAPPSGRDGEAGDLIDYSDTGVLAQFHEDALKRAGCGLSQMKILIACGLAMSGAALELAVIPFILPSAEIELCILEHEKSWLVMISLLGLCLGSIGWGNLCDRLGRRRALASCLGVNIVFSLIAAFMPTYGTLMMARLCSAIGSGGIAPAAFAYAAEVAPRACRGRALSVLLLFLGLGLLYAALVAKAVVPTTGAETLIENKEHFSAWHRYLLLCTLPILAALISLIWTPESPRYLLEVGREVDAMSVYQGIHAGNKIRVCGKKQETNSGDADYRLSELELPGKRRPPALHHVRHSVKMFWQAFFQLFSTSYRKITLVVGGTLFIAIFIQFGIAGYVPVKVAQTQHELFEASKKKTSNVTYTNHSYNTTLQNVVYTNVTFDSCVFRDMFMCHVTFQNCTFYNVTFTTIKTSYVLFRGSRLYNSSIIDTDIITERDMDPWCQLNNTLVLGMKPGCLRRTDLTWTLDGVLWEQYVNAITMLSTWPIAVCPYRIRQLSIINGISLICLPGIFLASSEHWLYILETAYRFLMTLVYFGATVMLLESFPANLRCTAYGLILSTSYVGAICARVVYIALASPIFVGMITCALTVAACTLPRKVDSTEFNLL